MRHVRCVVPTPQASSQHSLRQEVDLEAVQPTLLPDALQHQDDLRTAARRLHRDQHVALLVAQRVRDQVAEAPVLRALLLAVVHAPLRHLPAGVRDEDARVPGGLVGGAAQVVVGKRVDVHRVDDVVRLRLDVPDGSAGGVTRLTTTNNKKGMGVRVDVHGGALLGRDRLALVVHNLSEVVLHARDVVLPVNARLLSLQAVFVAVLHGKQRDLRSTPHSASGGLRIGVDEDGGVAIPL